MNTEDFEQYLHDNIKFDVHGASSKITNVLNSIHFEDFLEYDQNAVGDIMKNNVELIGGALSENVFENTSDEFIKDGVREALNNYIDNWL